MNQISRPRATRKLGRRIVAMSLEPADQEWIDSIVNILKAHGAEGVSRSLVVREALRHAKEKLGRQNPAEVLLYFHGGHPEETRLNEWNG